MFQAFRPSSPRCELARFVDFAFNLARQSGRPVALEFQGGVRAISPKLTSGCTTTLPSHVPLPPGTLDPRWARHARRLMVSPWHTATEGMWFVKTRSELLCMHLRAQGDVRFWRFHEGSASWKEA